MSYSDDDYSSAAEHEDNENMKVFCRLRPMNKLEMSKRSKNCVDLPDDDPRCITVDSPLEGDYTFHFDRVFEEYASQEEVYESAIAPVAGKLLEGYNCTVLAYGASGSGKTHSMMGLNGGVDGLLDALTQPKDEQPPKVNPESQGMILRTTHDIFQQIQQAPLCKEFTIRCSFVEIYLEKILDLLNPGGGEKLEIVENLAGDEAAGVEEVSGGVRIAGAAELCCFDEADVYGLLARGNACRTMSSTEMNTDSSRSHALFMMKVEQHDKETGTVTTSELHMVDLAGSEMASSQSASAAQRDTGAVQMEAKMINKSLTALHNCIRAQLENQNGAKHSIRSISRQSKLTRFLRPSFGGNCMTWIILTASPSSYNIGETISTIKFGQRIRRIQNPAIVNTDFSREVYRKRFRESEQQRKSQMKILKAVAQECKRLRVEAVEGTFSEDEHVGSLWDTIEELLASGDDADELDFNALIKKRREDFGDERVNSDEKAKDALEQVQREIMQLRVQLEKITKARDESKNQLSELQSEVAVLRSQNEHLIADKTKDLEELINAKNELRIMSQRKIEVEHNFRTSQFRENEAIVFLRSFRRFYRNVLRDKAQHGSGSIKAITDEISSKAVPGTLDLSELVDADALMLEAGLIEEHETGDQKSAQVYVPSKTALIRSATAAKKAAKEMVALEERLESEMSRSNRATTKESSGLSAAERSVPNRNSFIRRGSAIRRSSFASLKQPPVDEEAATTEDTEEKSENPSTADAPKQPGAGADAGAGSSQPLNGSVGGSAGAALLWDQSGVSITKRQQLLGTPAGRFSIMQEKNIERDLEDMADRCIKLEQALKEERATVEMLSGRAGGLNKKKLAQEAIQLRQQIEKTSQNLMATAWKMNELNLINKSYNEKMMNREQHVVYLEENYVQLQNRNRMIIEEQQEAERKLREELNSVRKVLSGMSVPLWQYREGKIGDDRSLSSRILVPVHGGSPVLAIDGRPPERRLSDAESEPSLGDFGERESQVVQKVDSSTQTDDLYREHVDSQPHDKLVEREEIVVQTEEVLHEDIGTMTNEVMAEVLKEDVAARSAPAKVAPDIVGAEASIRAAASIAPSAHRDEYEGSESDGTPREAVAASDVDGDTGAAKVVAIPSHTIDSSSEESESEGEADFTGKVAASGVFDKAVARSTRAAIFDQTDDDHSEESFKADSDQETKGTKEQLRAAGVSSGVASSITDKERNEHSDSDSEDESMEQTSAGTPSDDYRKDDAESDDDIEDLTGELAADGSVPQTVSVDARMTDDDNDRIESYGAEKPQRASGKMAAVAGLSGAAVVAAAATVAGRGRITEPEPTLGRNETNSNVSSGGKGDTFMAKNIFAATVMPVLNRVGNETAEEAKEAESPKDNDIESYHGDGHSPTRPDRSEPHAATSRDEWAAARDDFDSIFNETAKAVNTSSSRRRPVLEDDPEKTNRELMDIAAKIGHKSEDQIVTMGSKRQFSSHEVHIVEDGRRPWEQGAAADSRKPWEKVSKRGKEDGSLGSSIDITKDNWYDGSDESDDSYRFETHVLKRPQRKDPIHEDAHVMFSESTNKHDAANFEDEFDQMMNATQAALGAAEERLPAAEENDSAHDSVSFGSKEEVLFTGGRSNTFQPRRRVEKPRIRAGVLKEEKRSGADRHKSHLERKRSESRRRLDDDKKRKKKKDEKKKKKGSRSSRSIPRTHSHKRVKEDGRNPRRRSAG